MRNYLKFVTPKTFKNSNKFGVSALLIMVKRGIEKIEKNNDQIYLTFNENNKAICDHLIISDGVFSKGKSLISNDEIKPSYNNSIAIRGNISRNKL